MSSVIKQFGKKFVWLQIRNNFTFYAIDIHSNFVCMKTTVMKTHSDYPLCSIKDNFIFFCLSILNSDKLSNQCLLYFEEKLRVLTLTDTKQLSSQGLALKSLNLS